MCVLWCPNTNRNKPVTKFSGSLFNRILHENIICWGSQVKTSSPSCLAKLHRRHWCFKFPNKLTSMKLMASLVMAKVRKLSGLQNIKLEKKQNFRSQTKLQELLIGIIVNKKCLRKRLCSRIEMSFKHIMIQSVNKDFMCSFTVIVTKQQNRIHGILF